MLIRIRHETRYRYDQHVNLTAQVLRLWPQGHEGQRIVNWRVTAADRNDLRRSSDAYGNVIHVVTLHWGHGGAVTLAEGEVETRDTQGIVRGSVERLPPLYFLRSTSMTAADAAIRGLADEIGHMADPVESLHALMLAIRGRVRYVTGSTNSATSASAAFAQGQGVCQDHAHVFLAAVRHMGLPARYVSGYLWSGSGMAQEDASHAWAEVHVEGLGWIGFDVANGICPCESHVRVAVGLDYLEAAPVRGIRHGEAGESLQVSVDVRNAHQQ